MGQPSFIALLAKKGWRGWASLPPPSGSEPIRFHLSGGSQADISNILGWTERKSGAFRNMRFAEGGVDKNAKVSMLVIG